MIYLLLFLIAGNPVVEITSGGLQHSGVIIEKDGRKCILSASHILLFSDAPLIAKINGVNTPCEVIVKDHNLDLMLLTCPETSVIPLALGNVQHNQRATSQGYANGYKSNTTFVVDDKTYSAKYPLLYCRGPCLHGMSGGPLIQGGKIVGIQSSTPQNGCLYVPVEQIQEFLNRFILL